MFGWIDKLCLINNNCYSFGEMRISLKYTLHILCWGVLMLNRVDWKLIQFNDTINELLYCIGCISFYGCIGMPINILVTCYNIGVKCKFNLCQSKRVNKSILLCTGDKRISENLPICI